MNKQLLLHKWWDCHIQLHRCGRFSNKKTQPVLILNKTFSCASYGDMVTSAVDEVEIVEDVVTLRPLFEETLAAPNCSKLELDFGSGGMDVFEKPCFFFLISILCYFFFWNSTCVLILVFQRFGQQASKICVSFFCFDWVSAIQASGLCFKLLQRPEHFMREARDATLSATESSRRTSCVAWDASVVLAGLTSVGTGSQPPAEHLAPEDKAEDSELGDRKLSLLPFFIVLHCLIGQNHLSFHFGFEDAVPSRTKASQHSKFKPIFSFQTFFLDIAPNMTDW